MEHWKGGLLVPKMVHQMESEMEKMMVLKRESVLGWLKGQDWETHWAHLREPHWEILWVGLLENELGELLGPEMVRQMGDDWETVWARLRGPTRG